MKRYFHFSLIGLVLFASVLACQAVSNVPSATSIPNIPPPPSPAVTVPLPGTSPDLVSVENNLITIYENISPGVVTIRVLTQVDDGLGSGFVYDKEGHIITNYHVIEGFTDLEVDFPSGLKVRAEVIGTDLDSDIAVLKVDADPQYLHPLPIGDSEQIKVGQTVIAIGNPFGLSGSMTVGIVSAIGRTLASMRSAPDGNFFTAGDLIQTDTAINPGNSGGPLLNLNGEVIGINRAIRTESFSSGGEPVNSGIGFAVAINIVKRVVPSLIASGQYEYPYIGITSTSEITLLEQEALGLPTSLGVYITEVTTGGPADLAGLQSGTEPTSIPGLYAGGDLIVRVDDRSVLSFSDMLSYLINHKSPGDTVTFVILRDGQEMEVPLTLGQRP